MTYQSGSSADKEAMDSTRESTGLMPLCEDLGKGKKCLPGFWLEQLERW